MSPLLALIENGPTQPQPPQVAASALAVQKLSEQNTAETLAFLAERPVHTVIMSSFIRDNGLESSLNRGTFYACRNREGRLEGIALIGHATLVEARTEAAIQAFARIAKSCRRTHMIMGEQERVELFWKHYASGHESPRLACRELLFEQRWPVEVREAVRGLRRATLDDLGLIMPVHAAMAREESGIDPLEADPVGFRLRCARRIEQGRTWVWAEAGGLVFKADVAAETPEVVYLEGIYVDPDSRGKGYALRCLSQLGRNFLTRAGSVCVLVNERNQKAINLYRKANYKLCGQYDTYFMQKSQ